MRLGPTVLTAASLLALTGCLTLKAAKATPSSVEQAYADQDRAYLEKACWYHSKNIAKGEGYELACAKVKALDAGAAAAEQQQGVTALAASHDLDGLAEVCLGTDRSVSTDVRQSACEAHTAEVNLRFEAGRDCDVVQDTFHQLRELAFDDRVRDQLYLDTVSTMATCGQWDDYFTDYVHWGSDSNAIGKRGLVRLHKEGHDVRARMLAYLRGQSHPLAYEHGTYASSNLVEFMLEQDQVGDCSELAVQADRMPSAAVRPWLVLFSRERCSSGAKVAAKWLADDSAGLRSTACVALGDIGNSTHLRKLDTVASSDAAYSLDERVYPPVKVYYVRDACREAAGKVRLRQ